MSKNKIKNEALKYVPAEFRILAKSEIVEKTDYLWTASEKKWMKADFLVGELKAADFICVIREQTKED